MLRDAALLHDVGEVAGGVPAQPRAPRRRRSAHGILSPEQADWIRAHHEHMDGSGYPDGRDGSRLPVEARILAVADAWDALLQDAGPRAAALREEALEELRQRPARGSARTSSSRWCDCDRVGALAD